MVVMDYKKHLVKCPHCGKDVLDHMTECPFCHGELTPGGIKPLDREKLERTKRIINLVFFIIAGVIIIAIVVNKLFGA